MGEVRRPKDITGGKVRHIPDIGTVPSRPLESYNLADLVHEVEVLKAEVQKIKIALQKQGIAIE